MGLEEMTSAGLDIEDLVNIFGGHMEDRYQVSYLNPTNHIFHVDYGSFIDLLCAFFSV